MAKVDEAQARGTSLGGVFEIQVLNLPVGLGTHVHRDRRLDARLAQALISIQAVKGVEIGRHLKLPAVSVARSKTRSSITGRHRRIELRGFTAKRISPEGSRAASRQDSRS